MSTASAETPTEMPEPAQRSAWMDKRTRQRTLYPGQREALQLYADGMKYIEIAQEMGVALGTARSYVGASRVILGVDTLEEAVKTARAQGLIK